MGDVHRAFPPVDGAEKIPHFPDLPLLFGVDLPLPGGCEGMGNLTVIIVPCASEPACEEIGDSRYEIGEAIRIKMKIK
jgi:hypothetical protein